MKSYILTIAFFLLSCWTAWGQIGEDYNPDNPGDPGTPELKYNLKIKAEPALSGSFNIGHFDRFAPGEKVELKAYPEKLHRFVAWIHHGDTLSHSPNFTWTMPSAHSQLVGVFRFDPDNPGNPNANSWNPATGEIIIDEFIAGDLRSSIEKTLGESNVADILKMMVIGKSDNYYDFYDMRKYKNCTVFDLARVTGIDVVSSAFSNLPSCQKICLPEEVEKINNGAFAGCKQLTELDLHAVNPPELGENAFKEVPEELVVRVPVMAMERYRSSPRWEELTILPLQEDVRDLTVRLPEGVDKKAFSNMFIELHNLQNGQRQRMVVKDYDAYTFTNVLRKTVWSISLLNAEGNEFGHIARVEVNDDHVDVAFGQLALPQSASLVVRLPDETDITDRVKVVWMEENGEYKAEGPTLHHLAEGTPLLYSVELPEELAVQYKEVQRQSWKVSSKNKINCQLEPLPQVAVVGSVKDKTGGLALPNVTITARLLFANRYERTLNGAVDDQGQFRMKLPRVPTSLIVAAPDYISQTIDCKDYMDDATAEMQLPVVRLAPIEGAVIVPTFTIQTSVREGETAEKKDYYASSASVDFKFFNISRNAAIEQFQVQDDRLVILDETAVGDEIRITARPKNGEFMPVATTVKLEGTLRVPAHFDLVETGGVETMFVKNVNPSVSGMLYNEQGHLVRSFAYVEGKASSLHLPDGVYRLVSMTTSELFNNIYQYSQFGQSGLVEGEDYALNAVEVKSGQISKVTVKEVPVLDEAKLAYTNRNTDFRAKKAKMVVGNYQTYSFEVGFKEEYADRVRGLKLIVDLPESNEFVQNSVMVGSAMATCQVDEKQVTIPLPQTGERVRFCVMPMEGGTFQPNAYVEFYLEDELIRQPIGSAKYAVENLQIGVPNRVSGEKVVISGLAPRKSLVTIEDNEVVVAETSTLANGEWSAHLDMTDAGHLSHHNIMAKVTTPDGKILHSELKEMLYDKNGVEVSTIRMNYLNTWNHKNQEVVFDKLNGTTIPSSYSFFHPGNFTFTIDFTKNDPELLSNVLLTVYTSDGAARTLVAEYQEAVGKWTASDVFTSKALPVNADVHFSSNIPVVGDADMFYDGPRRMEKALSDYLQNKQLIEEFFMQHEDPDEEDFSKLEQQMGVNLNDYLYPSDDVEPEYSLEEMMQWDANRVEQYANHLIKEMQTINDTLSVYADRFNSFDPDQQVIRCSSDGLTMELTRNCQPSEEKLLASGYEKMILSDGSAILYHMEEYGMQMYVPVLRQMMTVDFNPAQAANKQNLNSSPASLARQGAVAASDNSSPDILGNLSGFFDQIGLVGNAFDIFKFYRVGTLNALERLPQIRASFKFLKETGQLTASAYRGLARMRLENSKILSSIANMTKTSQVFEKLGKVATVLSVASLGRDIYRAHQGYMGNKERIQLLESTAACKGNIDAMACLEGYRRSMIDGNIHNTAVNGQKAILIALSKPVGGLFATNPIAGGVATGGLVVYQHFLSTHDEYGQMELTAQKYENHIRLMKLDCIPLEVRKALQLEFRRQNNPDATGILDPSGYVYEAVPSNRLEGVKATCYYKESVEDMYGDVHDEVVKWNAEEYAQKNPLFTDKNGRYAWDVPAGLWQVRYEKEGYETTQSDWLPVPPPQLEVNIPMRQTAEPLVRNVKAYEDGVVIEFDKYMTLESLIPYNICLLADGHPVEGEIALLNSERGGAKSEQTYASKARFVAKKRLTSREVTLQISNRVKSYAGIRMRDNYQQTFRVEKEVKSLLCDSMVNIVAGETADLILRALPAEAAMGKRVSVSLSSASVVDTTVSNVVFDGLGQARIGLQGRMPGSTSMVVSLDDFDLSARVTVNVAGESLQSTETPTASIASGSSVPKGTRVSLQCATPNALIYYTLDGSCPCDNTPGRKIYYGESIELRGDVVLKAMAIAPNCYESGVATFSYTVTGIEAVEEELPLEISPLPVRDQLTVAADGRTMKRVMIVNVGGVKVRQSTKPATQVTFAMGDLPAGIYLVYVETDDRQLVRKVWKEK